MITFKKDVQSQFPLKRKIFNSVTTDWSWPAMNALTLTFNEMNLSMYLDAMYDGDLDLTLSHFMKIISDLCNKTFKENAALSKFDKDIFRLLANCERIEEAENIYKCVLFKFVVQNM